jgi:Cu(I)/Ag(I) efflux system membrane fusion protein
VAVSGEIIQSMGVRTAEVRRGTLWKHIRTVGRIDYDETRLAHVHPRASGWVERLTVRAEGEEVKRGQNLAKFYAPDILSAQVDFLVALKQYGTTRRDKVDKARNLLRLLDVPEDIINEIENKGETLNTVPLRAPIDGVLTRLGMRDGMYVVPSSEIATVADLSRVWVMVDVFEQQVDWLTPGLPAEIQVPARPGQNWEGELDYIYPELDPRTRTLKVRLSFPNPEEQLRPNMFAEVVIHGGPKHDVLYVPREALIVTGERETVVKSLGEGRFQPVDVVTGMRRSGQVEILSGLGEGDDIVISGQFLIDSESSLQASFLRMSETGSGGGHPHP